MSYHFNCFKHIKYAINRDCPYFLQKKLSLALLIIILAAPLCFAKKFSNIDSIYYWFCSQQTDEGLVLAETKDNFTVEEEALSVMVFLRRGHYNRAERILNFFQKLESDSVKFDEFRGFYRYYSTGGDPLSSEILASTQLWLLVAINEYALQTGDKKFLPLAISLSEVVLGLEGLDYGISAGFWGTTPLPYFTSADNLLALSVFPRLWSWSDISEYRFAAWRTRKFLQIFLWDRKQKNFIRRIYQSELDITDSLWSTLVFGGDYQGWINFPDPSDLYNKILLSLVYSMYEDKKVGKAILSSIEKNLVWSQKHWGAAGLPAIEGSKDIDVFTTAWYVLALEKHNPFSIDPDFWENKVMIPPSERQFKGDEFENGKLKTLLTYPAELIEEVRCKVIVDWEEKEVKSGKGALRIFFSPIAEVGSAEAVVTRRFRERQDFSQFSSIRIWLKATTTTRIFQTQLKVNIGLIDSDGELWYSPNLSIIGRRGFVNGFSFPSGWTRHPSSLGNNVFDIEAIRELKFLVYQPADTSWQIYLDELVLE